MLDQNPVADQNPGVQVPAVPAVDAQESESYAVPLADVLNPQADGGTQADENVANPAVGAPVGQEQPANAQTQQPVDTIQTQKDFNTALGRRLEQERSKFAPVAELADLVIQATGAKDLDEAKKMTREMLAERRAAQLGTTTEQEIDRISDRERIARLERATAPIPLEEAQASEGTTATWARDTLTRAQTIERLTGDTGFTSELLNEGSRINQRILRGDDVETVWREERGSASRPAASPYTRQDRPAPAQVERGTGGSAPFDAFSLSDEEMARIDDQLKRGIRVRLP